MKIKSLTDPIWRKAGIPISSGVQWIAMDIEPMYCIA